MRWIGISASIWDPAPLGREREREFGRPLLALAALILLAATPGEAQTYGNSVGWNVGALLGTSLNDGANASVDLEPDLSPSVAFHVDHWWGGGRTGIRVQVDAAQPEIEWRNGPREIAVYTGDLNLMLRALSPSADRTVAPYVSVGIGTAWWLLGNGPRVGYPQAGAAYGGDEFFHLTGIGSLGFDIITPLELESGPLVVRIEGRDAVQFRSPLDPLGGGDDFGAIHNIRVGIGVHTGFGDIYR